MLKDFPNAPLVAFQFAQFFGFLGGQVANLPCKHPEFIGENELAPLVNTNKLSFPGFWLQSNRGQSKLRQGLGSRFAQHQNVWQVQGDTQRDSAIHLQRAKL